jgi:flagellar biosynthesis/type III secretory pathway M-ring protein FliF/YscJ
VIPLLALEEADRYVAGAYLVFLLLLLIYVAIMAAKLSRIQRELGSLAELADRRRQPAEHDVGHFRDREEEIESVREETHREEAAR